MLGKRWSLVACCWTTTSTFFQKSRDWVRTGKYGMTNPWCWRPRRCHPGSTRWPEGFEPGAELLLNSWKRRCHTAAKSLDDSGGTLHGNSNKAKGIWIKTEQARDSQCVNHNFNLQICLGPDGIPPPSPIFTLGVRGSESRAVLFLPLIPGTLFLQPLDCVRRPGGRPKVTVGWWIEPNQGESREGKGTGMGPARCEKACWMMALETNTRASPVYSTLRNSREKQGKMLQESLPYETSSYHFSSWSRAWSCPALSWSCPVLSYTDWRGKDQAG